MKLLATLANSAWLAVSASAHRRFQRALGDPDAAQARVLRANLARNAASAYGRAHDFSRLASYADFARRVPVVTPDELAPWIDRIRAGEPAVLTNEPVTRLLPTSGTTAGRKLIPFTASLQHEFNAAIGPWIADLGRQYPAIRFGPGYWSVTPLSAGAADERSAVPIGFDDDSRYLGGLRARLIDRLMAVPSSVRHIADVGEFRHTVLRHLLRQRDLRLISVWHPSFLTLLLDTLVARWDDLLRDLGDTRRIRELHAADPRKPESLWPHLRVVSCWADGHATGAAAELQQRIPGVAMQPKGLLATEAFITLPFAGAHPLALNSHFLEFRDEGGVIHTAGALRIGETYEVIVTTGGGLYRYALGDRVEVTQRLQRTPCLRFLGRVQGSDLCGEKLSEAFVAGTLAGLGIRARFALLAPERTDTAWRYTLFLEPGNPLPELAHRLDVALSANPHYALCRRLGQLAAPAVTAIHGEGYAIFVAAETARGKRLGDLKPIALSARTDWALHFAPGARVGNEPVRLDARNSEARFPLPEPSHP